MKRERRTSERVCERVSVIECVRDCVRVGERDQRALAICSPFAPKPQSAVPAPPASNAALPQRS
jgi:hypothetical protein